MKHWRLWAVYLIVLFSQALTAQAEVAVPALTQYVIDLTATLDASQIDTLNSRLTAFEASKGSQIAVLIVPSTEQETIEQFSVRVFEEWKLGREKLDDGVLLVIAKEDRKFKIEVGYGLEGALTDATSKRIIAEVMLPHFKVGSFFVGIDAGLDAIENVVKGEALPLPEGAEAEPTASPLEVGDIFLFIFIMLVVGMIFIVLFSLLADLFSLFSLKSKVANFIGKLIAGIAVIYLAGLAAPYAFVAENASDVTQAFALFVVLSLLKVPRQSVGIGSSDSDSDSGDSSSSSSSNSDSSSSGDGGSSGGGGASGSW